MSSTERRDFLVGPKAVEHCGAKHSTWWRRRAWAYTLTTSTMYSINISSITFTASFAGFRSSPNPYIRFRTGKRKVGCLWRTAGVRNTLTFFRKQPLQIRLSFRSGGETPRPRVSAATGGVYGVCIARGRVRGRETSSSISGACGCAAGCRGSGESRRRRCRPMLWWHIRVVRPCCAVSGDSSGRIGVRCIRSRCLGVCCWSVSIRIGARLTRIVVRHGARLTTPGARHAIDLAAAHRLDRGLQHTATKGADPG